MNSRSDFIKGSVATGASILLLGSRKAINYGKEESYASRIEDYEELISREMQVIRSQLEMQGKLALLSVYERIIRVEVTNEMGKMHRIPSVAAQRGIYDDYSYVLQEGGVIAYNGFGGTTVVDTYMDLATTQAYVNDINSSIQASDVISDFLGMIPLWGDAVNFLISLITYSNNLAVQSVNNAGGYGYIMSVSHPLEGAATVLRGWNQYPIAIVPGDANNIHVEDFSNY